MGSMSILTPSDRTVLWRTVVGSGEDERASLRRVLAADISGTLGARMGRHDGLEDEIVETLALLDSAGLLERDDLCEGFAQADQDDDHAPAFAALLAGLLGRAADMEALGVEVRMRALRLVGAWQGRLLERSRRGPPWLTAPEVAARYSVTPQAVYKWIKAGRVRAEQTPGGSWRLPAEQFERGGRVDPRRLTELQARLLEDAGDAPAVSDEELADEIIARRRR
jgi:excisionase family DNA binding protein